MEREDQPDFPGQPAQQQQDPASIAAKGHSAMEREDQPDFPGQQQQDPASIAAKGLSELDLNGGRTGL